MLYRWGSRIFAASKSIFDKSVSALHPNLAHVLLQFRELFRGADRKIRKIGLRREASHAMLLWFLCRNRTGSEIAIHPICDHAFRSRSIDRNDDWIYL